MTDSKSKLARLSPARRALVESALSDGTLMRQHRQGSTDSVIDRAATSPTVGPASRAQRRMWTVERLAPGAAFTVPILHRIRGPLNVAALDRALVALVTRHAALRTTLHDDHGRLTQHIDQAPESILRVHDLSSLDPGNLRQDAAAEFIRAEIALPFDLERGPVFRASIVRVGADDVQFLMTLHHVACDQWSMGVFVKELAVAYQDFAAGSAPVFEPLPATYLSYSAAEDSRVMGGGFDAGLRYWRDRLHGMEPLTLPTDHPRPADSAQRGGEVSRWLDDATTQRIRECAAALGASPFMVTLAAFLVLMRSYGRAHDICLGTTASGREEEKFAGLVGFFVNTVVLRVRVEAHDTFARVVGRVRTEILAGHPHHDVPFDLIVDSLARTRDGTSIGTVPVWFQQDNTPDAALSLDGLDTVLDDDLVSGSAKYEILVSVRNRRDATRLHVQYDAEIFEQATAQRMLAGFEECLTAAISDPDTRVRDLPVTTAADQALVAGINDTATSFDIGPGTLHGLFDRQAERTPAACALIDITGRHWTHGQIADRSTACARALVQLGIVPGDRVILRMSPGPDLLCAALAVMKAGASFVPIDPNYPVERVTAINNSATAKLSIGAPLSSPSAMVTYSVAELTAAGRQAELELPTVDPHDPAYITFTSGSTGQPKGVVIRHSGIVNNLADLAARLRLNDADRVLTVSSPSFDMSVFELLGVPSFGGTAVVVDPEQHRDPAHWAERALAWDVTVWNSAPALLDLLLTHLESESAEDLPPLRCAVLGGDWVPLDLHGRWRSTMGHDAEFHVLGGATEASIHSTWYTVNSVNPQWRSIPYGAPMSNQSVIVVDDDDRPTPIGVPGHLLLGGAGLAVGYHDMPMLTAQKFCHVLGERRYRTGDIARLHPDGNLELLGRSDFMMKLNGLRIEPGDVEHALRRSGGLTGAVVVKSQDSRGVDRLVAFVTALGTVDLAMLREGVAAQVPSFMIPAEIHILDAFPVTPNGKIDRLALSTFVLVPAGPPRRIEAPQTPTERRVVDAWTTVLGTDVGRNDDFFELGGDSFLAIRAARLVGDRTPTVAIFRHSTAADLAAFLDAGAPSDDGNLLVRLSRGQGPTRRALVCVPYGGGNAVAYQPLAEALPEDYDVWAVNLPGHDLADGTAFEGIATMARRCAAEIGERLTGPVAIYGQCAGTAAAIQLARACEEIGVTVSRTFVGAALPDRDPTASMRLVRDGDDTLLAGHIRGLGGFDGPLDESDTQAILAAVRHDLREMVAMYLSDAQDGVRPLRAPVHCIVGSLDPATTDAVERYSDWATYGRSADLSVIDGGDHYFCKHMPHELASIICSALSDDAVVPMADLQTLNSGGRP